MDIQQLEEFQGALDALADMRAPLSVRAARERFAAEPPARFDEYKDFDPYNGDGSIAVNRADEELVVTCGGYLVKEVSESYQVRSMELVEWHKSATTSVSQLESRRGFLHDASDKYTFSTLYLRLIVRYTARPAPHPVSGNERFSHVSWSVLFVGPNDQAVLRQLFDLSRESNLSVDARKQYDNALRECERRSRSRDVVQHVRATAGVGALWEMFELFASNADFPEAHNFVAMVRLCASAIGSDRQACHGRAQVSRGAP